MVGGHLFHAICRQPQQDNGHLCGHFSALDRGVWRAWPRGPYARGPPAQRTPQFTWERFPVDILFAPRLFSPFRFSFCPLCPTSPFFFRALSAPWLTLQPPFLRFFRPSSASRVRRTLPRVRSFFFFSFFTPTLFTPELLPLMNRAEITRCIREANGAASAGWKDRPGLDRGKSPSERARQRGEGKRETVNYPDISARITRQVDGRIHSSNGDSFSLFFYPRSCFSNPCKLLEARHRAAYVPRNRLARRNDTYGGSTRGTRSRGGLLMFGNMIMRRANLLDTRYREIPRPAAAMLIESRRFTRDVGMLSLSFNYNYRRSIRGHSEKFSAAVKIWTWTSRVR